MTNHAPANQGVTQLEAMAIEFKLPEVSEGVESADIAELHVTEGDVIQSGQVVMEVETEKAVAEIECPHAGKITKIHVAEGDSVPIGAVLLTIEAEPAGKSDAQSAEPPSSTAAAQPPADTSRAQAPPQDDAVRRGARTADDDTEPGPPVGSRRAQSAKPAPEPQTTSAAQPERPGPTVSRPGVEQARLSDDGSGPPAPAGPATRRLARQLGVDLHRVSGSGPGGRVTADDVRNYVHTLTTGSVGGAIAPMAAPQLPDFNQFGPVERVSLRKLARTATENLSLAWRTVPHVTQHDLADITALEASRRRYMETAGRSGPKITMTAVVTKAVVGALKEFPHFNASLDSGSGELILKRYYHIGVAVDTEFGLLVPVIRDVDRKNVIQVAAEISELADRARNRKLQMEDMQGGTFTITNLGGIGGTGFTPIVNYPEVAILGMSRSRKELSLIDGRPEERLLLPLSLSYDHRVINGADAARFVVKLTRILSDSFQLLIEC